LLIGYVQVFERKQLSNQASDLSKSLNGSSGGRSRTLRLWPSAIIGAALLMKGDNDAAVGEFRRAFEAYALGPDEGRFMRQLPDSCC